MQLTNTLGTAQVPSLTHDPEPSSLATLGATVGVAFLVARRWKEEALASPDTGCSVGLTACCLMVYKR
jgi:hypothetical protein